MFSHKQRQSLDDISLDSKSFKKINSNFVESFVVDENKKNKKGLEQLFKDNQTFVFLFIS